ANPQVYERTLRSTAWVVSPLAKDKGAAIGTGVLVDQKRKWVLTNYHVVEDRTKAIVFFPMYRNGQVVTEPKQYIDGKKEEHRLGIPGEVIAKDRRRDLALLQLPSLPGGVQEIPLAAKVPKPGETLHAIGNSGAKDGTLWRYSKGEVRQVYAKR